LEDALLVHSSAVLTLAAWGTLIAAASNLRPCQQPVASAKKKKRPQAGLERCHARCQPELEPGNRSDKPFVFCSTCRQWKSAAGERPGPFGAAHCRAEHIQDHTPPDEAGDNRLEVHQGALDRSRRPGDRGHRDAEDLCDHHSKGHGDPEGDRELLWDLETAWAVSKKLAVAGRLGAADSRLLRLERRSEDRACSPGHRKREEVVRRNRLSEDRE
jgi:hypothetical protein